jgi:hypothetical protein
MVYQVPQASYREARDAQQSMRFAPSVEARGGGIVSRLTCSTDQSEGSRSTLRRRKCDIRDDKLGREH